MKISILNLIAITISLTGLVSARPQRYVNYNIQKYPDRWENFVDFTHGQIDELMSDYGKVDIYFDMIFDIKVARLRIIRQARQRQYDLIHTATPGSMGLNALLAAQPSAIPMIGSCHTSLPEYVKDRVDHIVKKFHLSSASPGDYTQDFMWKYLQCPIVQGDIRMAKKKSRKSASLKENEILKKARALAASRKRQIACVKKNQRRPANGFPLIYYVLCWV